MVDVLDYFAELHPPECAVLERQARGVAEDERRQAVAFSFLQTGRLKHVDPARCFARTLDHRHPDSRPGADVEERAADAHLRDFRATKSASGSSSRSSEQALHARDIGRRAVLFEAVPAVMDGASQMKR